MDVSNPLVVLLSHIASDPRSSGLELRARLKLERSTYQDLLGHLVRMGYLAERATGDTCAPAGCENCSVGCQSTPETGARHLELTDRGRSFLARSGQAGNEI